MGSTYVRFGINETDSTGDNKVESVLCVLGYRGVRDEVRVGSLHHQH